MNTHLSPIRNMIAGMIVFAFASNSIAMWSNVGQTLRKFDHTTRTNERFIAYDKTIVEPNMIRRIIVKKYITGPKIGKADVQDTGPLEGGYTPTIEYGGEKAEKLFEEFSQEYESLHKAKLP